MRWRRSSHFIFDGYYDAFLTMSLYKSYTESNDDSTLNELLKQVAPLVGMVAKCNIGHLTCDYGTVLSDAFLRLYDFFAGHGLAPTNSPRSFTAFLYTMIYREMIDSIRSEPRYIFNYETACVDPPLGRLPTYLDVDRRLYFKQTRELLRRFAEDEIRFTDPTDKDACLYIISCILGYKRIEPASVQFKFKLSKKRANTLVQYCEILVKRLSYDVKELVDADP